MEVPQNGYPSIVSWGQGTLSPGHLRVQHRTPLKGHPGMGFLARTLQHRHPNMGTQAWGTPERALQNGHPDMGTLAGPLEAEQPQFLVFFFFQINLHKNHN